jgi:hypothetical protein
MAVILLSAVQLYTMEITYNNFVVNPILDPELFGVVEG